MNILITLPKQRMKRMRCLYKNVECEYAGKTVLYGCKELGEEEGFHEYGICYNKQINMDYTKCNR